MYKHFLKRFFDILLCGFAIIFLLPVYFLTAISIKLSSPGPVFYYSKRTGKNHKAFKFYKFRSMHVTNKDKGLFVADAERLFAVGKIIRRLKIDELPQLVNVIIGDMSIVGPRPMPIDSVDKTYYGKYQKILSITPGLTSAASLFDYTVGDTYKDDKAYRKEVLPIKLEMELMYVEHQCFLYDVELVWRTIKTIIQVMFGKHVFKEQPELAEAKRRVESTEKSKIDGF